MAEEVATTRAWVRIPTDKLDQMTTWAEGLGMSQAQFIGICAWVGARTVMRTLEPEKFFSTEQWGEIMATVVKLMPEGARAEALQQLESEVKDAKADLASLLPDA